MAKAVSPFTPETWAKTAPIKLVVDGKEYTLAPRQHSSGSLGYSLTTRETVTREGQTFDLLYSVNLTIAGSKPAK